MQVKINDNLNMPFTTFMGMDAASMKFLTSFIGEEIYVDDTGDDNYYFTEAGLSIPKVCVTELDVEAPVPAKEVSRGSMFRKYGELMDMCEQAGYKFPFKCIKYDGNVLGNDPIFMGDGEYEFAIGLLDNTPVFEDSLLVLDDRFEVVVKGVSAKDTSFLMVSLDGQEIEVSVDRLSWTKKPVLLPKGELYTGDASSIIGYPIVRVGNKTYLYATQKEAVEVVRYLDNVVKNRG